MGPSVRRFALSVHITVSVGWIGAVLAYIVMDVTAVTTDDPATVRAAWFAMARMAVWVILPLGVASFLTGLWMALGTKWGLFRHYWVLISFFLTLFALLVLVSQTNHIQSVATTAADVATTDERLLALPGTLPHSVGGLVVLLIVQVLNLYKPRGLTRYGWRRLQEEKDGRASQT